MTEISVSRIVRDLSDVDLRAVVEQGGREFLSPARAFVELSARQPKEALEDAAKVLQNHRAAPDLRRAAIETLGRTPTREAGAILAENLRAEKPAEVRDTLRALGRIGGKAELAAVRRMRVPGGSPLFRDVEASARLIAFRNGLDGVRIKRPGTRDLIGPPSDKVQEMPSRPVKDEALRPRAKEVQRAVPGIKLALDRAVELECLGARLWFYNSAALRDGGIDKAREVPQIPMVIMGHAACPSHMFLYGYVMSQPGDEGLELFVTRLRGDVTHFGQVRLSRQDAKFELEALRSRLAPPATLAGGYKAASGALSFERAIVSTDRSAQLEMRLDPRARAQPATIQGEPAGSPSVPPVIEPGPN
ncbi:MAG: hypothetical protein AAFR57_11240 [Pseudomonadota bacterium]